MGPGQLRIVPMHEDYLPLIQAWMEHEPAEVQTLRVEDSFMDDNAVLVCLMDLALILAKIETTPARFTHFTVPFIPPINDASWSLRLAVNPAFPWTPPLQAAMMQALFQFMAEKKHAAQYYWEFARREKLFQEIAIAAGLKKVIATRLFVLYSYPA